MFRSQKPRADEVIFSEEKFQKPLLINFFAWEKKLCLLLHGLPPKEELDPPHLHCIGESVTEKAVASIQMPKPAGGHWMRPSHSTPQRCTLGMKVWLGNAKQTCFQGIPICPALLGRTGTDPVAQCFCHCPTKPLTLCPEDRETRASGIQHLSRPTGGTGDLINLCLWSTCTASNERCKATTSPINYHH